MGKPYGKAAKKRTLQQIAADLKELYAACRNDLGPIESKPEYVVLMKELDEITGTEEAERDEEVEEAWEQSK